MGRKTAGERSAVGGSAINGTGGLTLEYVESDTDSDGSSGNGDRSDACDERMRSDAGPSVASQGQAGRSWGGVSEVRDRGVVGSPMESPGKVPLRAEVLEKLKKLERRAQDRDLNYKGKVFGPTLKERQGKSSQKPTECDWFSMPPTKPTEQTKQDLTVLSMRSCFGSVGLYKSEGRKGMPKWFQIGSILDDPTAPPSHRLPKRLRKRSLAEQLLSEDAREKLQRRFQSIQDTRAQQAQVLKKNYPALHKRQKMRHGKK
ncbi:unnamed protein product [Ostreobium quekettii]|uniref:Fcf2 pre-rRNA processing C-terminal domain-containing protein n=1 Tax=Ostreobium quekettii TaxID=121088 RepID=A0A8S1IPP6_9CHLO|nr:unnamed protein product [Ostreobium quekettii]